MVDRRSRRSAPGDRRDRAAVRRRRISPGPATWQRGCTGCGTGWSRSPTCAGRTATPSPARTGRCRRSADRAVACRSGRSTPRSSTATASWATCRRHASTTAGPGRPCACGVRRWSTRLAAEGHPIEAGSAGENITIRGVDWSSMRGGAIIDIGSVRCQLSAPATPCSKNRRWFRDGDIGHMDHDLHPGWSRWYASVLRPGSIRVWCTRRRRACRLLTPGATLGASGSQAISGRVDRPRRAARRSRRIRCSRRNRCSRRRRCNGGSARRRTSRRTSGSPPRTR